ncbi:MULTISPECIES: hypothetical protein [Bacillus]|uniref:Uncharacterized protein n=2 Tax=Bacillus thuringiensis TaxID=1428 RepID=A0AAP4Q7L3_BACTU|nr:MULTISPECIES: hypothetical protein [Bacillus]MEC0046175.1 hypothetical protein [Bacillus cereus]AFV21533.1 hypothetical protein BTB_502p02280 [Bacillus thuringiensis Bt407]EEM25432.1 hypothetical protein bthur0002_60740 [Bacillus thuringiensis Bt407]ERI01291.1 hypothetical protein BTCBT_002846 [Bacillus thuringiensis T01-328]MBN6708025.1 hypothetical protein [Bacillus thuringiensis]
MDLINEFKNTFKMIIDWENDGVYALSNECICLMYIEPHEGADWKYLIRIDYRKTFERWSATWYEHEIADITDANKVKDLMHDIKVIIEYENKVVVKTPNDGKGNDSHYALDDSVLEGIPMTI